MSQKLRARLSGAEQQKITKDYTANTEAYQLYLKGRFHMFRLTPPEVQKDLTYFKQAIEIDPKRAEAYVRLAVLYRHQGRAEQGEELLLQALEAAPENPEPYWWLAQLREEQQLSDEAINLYRKIVELQPSNVEISDATRTYRPAVS